jgi:hypothetical protein
MGRASATATVEASALRETTKRLLRLESILEEAEKLVEDVKRLLRDAGSARALAPNQARRARKALAELDRLEQLMGALIAAFEEKFKEVLGKKAELYRDTLEALQQLRWHKETLKAQMAWAFI